MLVQQGKTGADKQAGPSRREKLWEHGGEECSGCGKQDYESNMEEIGGKMYCADCLADREADFEQVANSLRTEHGLDAEVWPSGGGIDVIRIPLVGGYVVNFGTAADMWGGTVELDDEYTGEEVWTTVSSLETDPSFVAGGIAEALAKFI